MRSHRLPLVRPLLVVCALACMAAVSFAGPVSHPEFLDPNPSGNNEFGKHVVFLTNGNVVITAPKDDYAANDAGAVYLFDGSTGALLSALRGVYDGDQVGSGGAYAVGNDRFIVVSPLADVGGVVDAGGFNLVSGTSTYTGSISNVSFSSGSTADDQVGLGGVTVLPNGNCVVRSPRWDNGSAVDAGAVTFIDPNFGYSGWLSSSNSLVGVATEDRLGSDGITVVGNGNFVVQSPFWHSPSNARVGAATWCSGTTGRTGLVSSANSLIGASGDDFVGSEIVVLTNGNFVVPAPYANIGALTDAGAVTFGLGNFGLAGVVGSTLSLVGGAAYDMVGSVTPLTNGNYVVGASVANNGALSDVGAVTWCSGVTGRTGTISSLNSFLGASAGDMLGGVLALTNGHYVAHSKYFKNGAATGAGAAVWCNGTSGRFGIISAGIALTSSQTNANVGYSAEALPNGNYVITSPYWDNGAVADAGAVTLCNGVLGTTGTVSSANSLYGVSANDGIGSYGVLSLPNGNYVVRSPYFDNGAVTDAGAVTLCSGTTGRIGAVSASNSLVGAGASQLVGYFEPTSLTNGNFAVRSPGWKNGATNNAGSVTWCNGTTGTFGVVSAANSLVGTQANDQVGFNPLIALASGDYVVGSPFWDNGALADAGAVTWCRGTGGTVGPISAANSIIGTSSLDKVGDEIVTLPDGSWVTVARNWDNGTMSNAGAARWAPGGLASVGAITQANSVFGFRAGAGLAGIAIDSTHSQFAASFLTESGGGRVRMGPLPDFTLAGVTDIASDQGGWVRASFTRAPYDDVNASAPVQSYGLWRRLPGTVPALAHAFAVEDEALSAIRGSLGPEVTTVRSGGTLVATVREGSATGAMPAGTWELLANVPAFAQPTYLAVVPTVTNLTSTEFVVTAHTALPAIWFATSTVFGQSVDNLAPAQPSPFTGAYTPGNTHLTWGANTENDLAGYWLYRGSNAGFTPSTGNRIAKLTSTSFDDAITGGYVYKLTAVDVNGNESPVATVIPAGTTDVESGPVAFALEGVRPNPANGRALAIAFALPDAAPAKLELLDVSGRRVAAREVGGLGAGRHTVNLSESRAIPAGLYWARLTQGSRQRSVRVAVVE